MLLIRKVPKKEWEQNELKLDGALIFMDKDYLLSQNYEDGEDHMFVVSNCEISLNGLSVVDYYVKKYTLLERIMHLFL